MRYCNLFVLFATFSLTAHGQKTGHKNDSLAAPDQKHVLAFPFVLRSNETSWGFGGIAAFFFRPNVADTGARTSDANVLALYTLRKQQVYALNTTIYFPNEDQILRFMASYSYYPDDFWGLGDLSPQSNKEPYSQQQVSLNGQFLQRLVRKVYVGLNYQYQYTGAVVETPGGIFSQQNITGRLGGNVSGIGPILSWDSRNASYSPTAGFFAEIKYVYFNQAIGSNFNFSLLDADIRKYISLSQTTVLALQGIADIGSGEVPYRQLAKLGGTDMMRGYYAGRFTDKSLVATQFEVRQFLFWRLGVVGFGAMGEVAPDVKRFYFPDMHYSYGAGLRLALSSSEKLNLRFDYGRGPHSSAADLQIREAF